jgi:hypothetical protein
MLRSALVLILLGILLPVCPADDAEEKAIARVHALGGYVRRDISNRTGLW